MPSQGDISVLIVDDDEEYLRYMEQVLTRAGHICALAGSAHAALSALAANNFTLVIVDMRLEGRSGLEVLAAARKADPLTVGIVMTAFGSLDAAMQALREGAYDFLLKPCTADVVEASARRALEYYELRQAILRKSSQLETLHLDFKVTMRMLEDLSIQLQNPLDPQEQDRLRATLQQLLRCLQISLARRP